MKSLKLRAGSHALLVFLLMGPFALFLACPAPPIPQAIDGNPDVSLDTSAAFTDTVGVTSILQFSLADHNSTDSLHIFVYDSSLQILPSEPTFRLVLPDKENLAFSHVFDSVGWYAITAHAYSGITLSDEKTWYIQIFPSKDRESPMVVITSPTRQDSFSTGSTSIQIAGTIVDNEGAKSLFYSLEGATNGIGSIPINELWSTEIGIDTGITQIIVSGCDSSGNCAGDTLVVTSRNGAGGMPEIAFARAQKTVAEAAGVCSIRVALTESLSDSVAVKYGVTSTGTAVLGTDFVLDSSNLWFAPGQTTRYLRIVILDDSDLQGDLFFEIILYEPSFSVTLGQPQKVTCRIVDDEQLSVYFPSSAVQTDESSGTVSIPVNLSRTPQSQVTLEVSVGTEITASENDYTLTQPLSLSFETGQAVREIQLPIVDDKIDEENEQVILKLRSPTAGLLIGADSLFTVTILDNDTSRLSIRPVMRTITESEGIVTLQAVLSHQFDRSFSVSYDLADECTAVPDSDFTLQGNGILSFSALDTVKNFTVSITDDDIKESDERISLVLRSATNGVKISSDSLATLTISDNESQTVSIVSSGLPIAENGSEAIIGLQLSSTPLEPVIIGYATIAEESNASSGSDYALDATGQISIPANGNSASLTIEILDDNIREVPESLKVAFWILGDEEIPFNGDSIATVVFQDNETLTAGFSIESKTVSESDGIDSVAIELSSPAAFPVHIRCLATSLGNAPTESYSFSTETVEFSPGDTLRRIGVALHDNSTRDGDRTLILALDSLVPALADLARDTLTLTIADDEELSVYFSEASSSWSESAQECSLLVELSTESAQAVSVVCSLGTEGTASAGEDFSLDGVTIVEFPAGMRRQWVYFTLVDDTVDENSEQFELHLGVSSSDLRVGTTAQHSVTIEDDDTAVPSFGDAEITVAENGSAVSVRVNLSCASVERKEFSVIAGLAGTADSSTDYTIDNSSTVVFEPGQILDSIMVTPLADGVDEPGSDTLVLELRTDGSSSVLDQMRIVITDSDAATEVYFSQLSSSISENDATGTKTVTIQLSTVSSQDITIQYQTTDGTATSPDDYPAVSSTVKIAAGEENATIQIPIVNDNLYETSETFSVSLSLPSQSPATLRSSASAHTITITNDDSEPVLSFDVGTPTEVNESDGIVTINLSLAPAGGADTHVRFRTLASTPSSSSATPGIDYETIDNTLTIPAGHTSASATITLTDDNLYERTEYIRLNLGYPTSGSMNASFEGGGTSLDHSLGLLSEESKPTVGFSALKDTVDEGSSYTASITLQGISAYPVQLTVSTTDGTAAAGTDFTAPAGPNNTLTIASGETSGTFTISTLHEDPGINERDKEFTLTMTASMPDDVTAGTMQQTVTVGDLDRLPSSVVPVRSSVATDSRKDGSCWYHAYDNLHTAIDQAAAAGKTEVWVARGTYTPTEKEGQVRIFFDATPYSTYTFRLEDGLAIYGGFVGTESEISERILNNSERSILSGGGPVIQCGIGNVLDGLHIKDGEDQVAGGILSKNPVVVRNCIFENNRATTDDGIGGGAIGLGATEGISEIENSVFFGNYGVNAIVRSISQTMRIVNCLFVENENGGSGTINSYENVTVVNCTFANNYTLNGSEIKQTEEISSNGSSRPDTVVNCIFQYYEGAVSMDWRILSVLNSTHGVLFEGNMLDSTRMTSFVSNDALGDISSNFLYTGYPPITFAASAGVTDVLGIDEILSTDDKYMIHTFFPDGDMPAGGVSRAFVPSEDIAGRSRPIGDWIEWGAYEQ